MNPIFDFIVYVRQLKMIFKPHYFVEKKCYKGEHRGWGEKKPDVQSVILETIYTLTLNPACKSKLQRPGQQGWMY